MKKRILTKLNVFLGTISLVLAGCHSTRDVVAKYGPPPQPEKYGPPMENMEIRKGKIDPDGRINSKEEMRSKGDKRREPVEIKRQPIANDTIVPNDTIAPFEEEAVSPDNRVVCKYGVPPHLLKE